MSNHRDPLATLQVELAGIDRGRDLYRDLLGVAQRHGDEYEIDRCRRQLDELDAVVDRAILAGFGPDELAGGSWIGRALGLWPGDGAMS